MNHRSTRLTAGIATLAITASVLTGAPASADPSPSSAAGAAWLRADLDAGGLFQYSFGGVDGGLNIDAGIALVEAGDQEGAAAQRERLAPETDGYITGEAFGDEGSTYANAVAKLLSFVVASGGDPTSYDGKNLVTRLEAQVGDGTEGTVAGELFDTSIYGNNTNTIGQAFAADGLHEAGSDKSEAVTSHLLAQQCADGHFPLSFRTAAEDTCLEDGSVDVTALVLVGLRGQADDPAVETVLRRGAAYIAGAQAADGSVGGAPPTTAPNANTTGLAAWALGESCALGNAYRAAAWTRALQVDEDQAGTELAGEVGAIAYDGATLTRDEADGIAASERDQYRRATAQAANGLAYDAAAVPTVRIAGPTDFVRAGSRFTLRVTGIGAGDAPCLVTAGGGRVLLGDDVATSDTALTAPGRTGAFTYSATTGPGLSRATVKVLAAKTLGLRVRSRVARGGTQRAIVTGLASGEKVTVRSGGAIVSARADSRGTVNVTFRVSTIPGVKTVSVVGQFADRKASTRFTVVR